MRPMHALMQVEHIISEPTMMGQHARNMFLNGDKQSGLAAWKVRCARCALPRCTTLHHVLPHRTMLPCTPVPAGLLHALPPAAASRLAARRGFSALHQYRSWYPAALPPPAPV